MPYFYHRIDAKIPPIRLRPPRYSCLSSQNATPTSTDRPGIEAMTS